MRAEAEVRALSAGVNQQGVRDHNERLILSIIQRHGAMPGSDIARITGLSPQTVSVILRGLEQDGFVERGEPQRGRVGKPSIPMGLAPGGVYSVGLKIGRRTADFVLTDFLGQPRLNAQVSYRYPTPARIFDFLKDGLDRIDAKFAGDRRRRIAGIGIAKPSEIWSWHDAIGAPKGALDVWKDVDLVEEIGKFSDLQVQITNDATAACRAEHIYGRGREFRDYAYIFVGSFIGGGVVLNHTVFEGQFGYAGAFGPIPVTDDDGSEKQLIDVASLYLLEQELEKNGIAQGRMWSQLDDWSEFSDIVDRWVARTARHLARAALTTCAVIDFEAVVIDGAFPVAVREQLAMETSRQLHMLDTRGLIVPQIEAGVVGHNARALGAASGPIFSQYLLNTHGGLSVA